VPNGRMNEKGCAGMKSLWGSGVFVVPRRAAQARPIDRLVNEADYDHTTCGRRRPIESRHALHSSSLSGLGQ
jgi:hypothetical protein